mmetsp:Transcript_17298/g.40187  ORF Transcript_17298/g.40187 Transcript_17298/m.40187 type:complete len:211 (-) Transcript_17298:340-972(-)
MLSQVGQFLVPKPSAEPAAQHHKVHCYGSIKMDALGSHSSNEGSQITTPNQLFHKIRRHVVRLCRKNGTQYWCCMCQDGQKSNAATHLGQRRRLILVIWVLGWRKCHDRSFFAVRRQAGRDQTFPTPCVNLPAFPGFKTQWGNHSGSIASFEKAAFFQNLIHKIECRRNCRVRMNCGSPGQHAQSFRPKVRQREERSNVLYKGGRQCHGP